MNRERAVMRGTTTHPILEALTPGELSALITYARLGDSAATAAELGRAVSTTRNYLSSAYDKLGAHGAIEAFRTLGWLRVPTDVDVAITATFARIETLQRELLALLTAPGSDVAPSESLATRLDEAAPLAGVAVTPEPSLRRIA